MLAVLGAIGALAVQHWGRRQSALPTRQQGRRSPRDSSSGRAPASSGAASTTAPAGQQSSRSALKDNALVCFRDRRGDLAVVQPHGSGSSWQLVGVTCAGARHSLCQGMASVAVVQPDAVFLVQQVEASVFAFRSLGADGGFYLSAVRDLAEPPRLDSHKLTPAAQWRAGAHGVLTNVQHPHKKLSCFSVMEVKAVPLDAMAAAARDIDAALQRQADAIAAAEAGCAMLHGQLQEADSELRAASMRHQAEAGQLASELAKAQQVNSQLRALAALRDEELAATRERLAHLNAAFKKTEAELNSAYRHIAQLQQAATEQGDELQALQHASAQDRQQWAQSRVQLQALLHQKNDEIAELSVAVQRMHHALGQVDRMLFHTRTTRLDPRLHASLEAVSLEQLHAVVDSFGRTSPSDQPVPEATPTGQAEALRALLAQPAGDAELLGDLATAIELPCHDLDHQEDQSLRPKRSVGARPPCPPSGQQGGSKQLLQGSWGNDSAVASSRGARSSAASGEGTHRYSSEAGSDEEAASEAEAEAAPLAEGEEELDEPGARRSVEEQQLLQELRRLRTRVGPKLLSPVREERQAGARGAAQ